MQPAYWHNYRDTQPYMSSDERHSTRQSGDTGTQSTFDSPAYTASSLRSYESYSTTGKSKKKSFIFD